MTMKSGQWIRGWLAGIGLAVGLHVAGADARPSTAVVDERPTAVEDQAIGAGAILEALNDAGVPARLRVEAVEMDPRDQDGDVRLYTLSQLDPVSGSWHSYCSPDAEGRSRAIPVQGSWRVDGSFDAAAGRVTFACTSGAIAKCIRFGYKPWKIVDGVSLRDHHQACMRMVRADYCGDGRAHTRDGTRIDMWDRLGIQQRTDTSEYPEVFEAAWGPHGAEYVNVPRWSEDVQALASECPDRLGQRTSASQRLSVTEVSHRFPQALLFNGRFIHDADRMGLSPKASP
jgi:hypothetical protein